MKATSKKETSIHPYKTKIFYVDGIEKPFSVRSIQHSIAVGKLQPDTEVTDSDGGIFFAQDIANFKAPQWAQTMSTDPLLGNVPRPEVSVEIEEGDIEMPLSDTGLSEKSKTRQTMSVRNGSEGSKMGRNPLTGGFSIGCIVPPGQPLASHSPERVAKAVELAVRRSSDPDFESDDFVGGIDPKLIDDVILSVLRKRDPAAAKRDAALDRTVAELQEAVLHEIFGSPDNQTDKPVGNHVNQSVNQRKPMTSMSVFDFPSRDIPALDPASLDVLGAAIDGQIQRVRESTPIYGNVASGEARIFTGT